MHVTTGETATIEESKKSSVLPKQFKLVFVLVTSLFFLWAIAHNLNDILIRQFQKALDLSRGEASFIQIAFYLAYFFAAIPAGIIMKKLGFKKAIVIGLLLYAVGAALFYPAAEVRNYSFFLLALFILASGIVFLETSGSGYITLIGDKKTSARRINFSQSFNGLGAVSAPLIGGMFIFSGIEYQPEQLAALSSEALENYRIAEAKQVQIPYLVISGILVCLAFAFMLVKFPQHTTTKTAKSDNSFTSMFKHKSFVAALVAQFFYVGAQIGMWSYFIDYIKELTPETPEKTAAYLLSVSLVLFMVGRFFGTYLMNKIEPRVLLARYALICITLVTVALFTSGYVAVFALIAVNFFMSIMFPTIYALGLEKLGDKAEVGSSLIIMTIISGAMIPPLMGFWADAVNVQSAYMIPLLCFAVVWISLKFGKE